MADSSTEQDLEPQDFDVNPADSSPADQGGSMLDAVLSAIEPKDTEKSPYLAPVPDGNTGTQAVAPKDGAATDPDPDMTEAEIASLHHKTKKQINKLIGQRRDLEYSVQTMRPKAEEYDKITSHIRQTGLNKDDLDNLFEIGTLMKKGDLFAARDKLYPFVQAIMEATGGVLPKDLQAAVTEGKLSPQHARELAEARSRNVLNQHQNNYRQQTDANEGARQFLGSVVGAVNDWEQAKRRSDPDWGLKAPEIKAALELAIFKGQQPKTTQEAVQMAEDALAAVNAKLKSFRPQPRPLRPISGSPQASSNAAGEPKSMLEAIMQSVNR